MVEGYTIGKVAALSGVSIDTIRFYERKGLVATPQRNSSGYRIYSQEMLNQIRFIKWSRDLGFSLQEAGELIPLFLQKKDDGDRIRELIGDKVREIDLDITNLVATKKDLQQLINALDALGNKPATRLLLEYFIDSK